LFFKSHLPGIYCGGPAVPGTLETILELLPSPIQIDQRGTILIVVDYEIWKQMVLQKQSG
jgi:hypothetical protein